MKFYHITLLKYNEIRIELYRSCIKHFSNLSFFAANAYHHLYPLIVPIRSDALSIRLNEGTESFGWWKFLVLGSDYRENRLQCPTRILRLAMLHIEFGIY